MDENSLEIESHPTGMVLPVWARAGGRRNEIQGVQNGALKVSVTQAPERGKANQAILELLCNGLDLRKSQLELLSGATSSQKRFLIRGLEAAELLRKIAAVTAENADETSRKT